MYKSSNIIGTLHPFTHTGRFTFFGTSLIWLLLSVLPSIILSQDKQYPEDPVEFLAEFKSRVAQGRGELASKVDPEFSTLWNSGQLTSEDKKAFIDQINLMIDRQFQTTTTPANFALSLTALYKADNYVQIPAKDFLDVTNQCIKELERDRVNSFLLHFREYINTGMTAEHRKFSWKATEQNPQLSFITLKEEEQYSAPVIRFMETDLIYTSSIDTSIIEKTSGDFNLIARTFIGNKGKVSWEKVGLDPEDVYCEFHRYKLNFNYGYIEADSVDFYYHDLINEPKPLVGRFVDKNIGHKGNNFVDYPFFKSYSGGVVIEELIPNVRYEGGFSLRGTRKIGTSYNIFVDPAPRLSRYSGDPEQEDFYSGYEVNEFYEDEKTDANYDENQTDEWGNSISSNEEYNAEDPFADPFETEGSWYTPEKVQQTIKAKLLVKRNNAYVMKLQSDAFVIDETEMTSDGSEVTIYATEKDSLYHPNMSLQYKVDNSTAVLYKPKKGTAKSIPFTSSFHEFYLYFETIKWNLDRDSIVFTSMLDMENKLSAIESFDYYTKARFDQFKNILKVNPIGAIYRYSLMHKDQSIFPEDITKDLKIMDQLDAFKRALPALEGSGFIKYNKQTYEIFPQDKLFKWAKAARGKKDYDAIQVISKVDTGAYAMMNIQTQNIRMRGVPYISLSDSQYIQVVPREGEVLVQQNRNLLFAGAVASGKLNLYANDEDNRPRFTFDYENFHVKCDSLDSVRFVLVRNPSQGYEPSPLERALSKTVFENVTGTLHIDDPRNKSGKNSFPEYPIFDSYSSSYVYWDDAHIQEGIYTKQKFYFSVDPFVLDSLEDFDNQGITFDGTFFSSEIFPEFRQTLTVMEDFTLGFVQETPEEGYNIYDYKGKYYNDIYLDGNGLQGKGKLENLDATVVSDSFVFHFDSVMAVVDTFSLPPSYRTPKVDAVSSEYIWYTKEDRVLLASSEDNPISIFDGEAEFEGKLYLSKDGLIGDGSITVGQIRVADDSIVFRERDFEADAKEFAVVDSINKNKVHFQASNVSIDIDLFRREAHFEALEVGKPNGSFPMHNYITSLTTGEFNMSSKELVIEGKGESQTDNYFISTSKEGDSIKFAANEAFYDVETQEIEIDNVPAIFVADAIISPPDAALTIDSTGIIRSFEDATIEADVESKFHRIYEASVQIYSGSEYEGSGKYDYIKVNDNPQYIVFENISVNSDSITVATGEITEDQNFHLTDRIIFKGTAELDASDKFLSFEGEVRIESENPVFVDTWFPLEKIKVNPDSVYIPIPSDMENDYGETLTSGINYIEDTRIFYSNFLQAKTDPDDIELVTAYGGLTLDRKTQEFIIGSEEKIKGKSYKGTTVAFNDVENIITSSGYTNLKFKFDEKTVQLEMAGSWVDKVKEAKISTDLLLSAKFDLIPEEFLDKVVDNFRFLTTSNNDLDFLQNVLLSSVSEILDKDHEDDKEARKFEEVAKQAMVYTDVDLAERFESALLLSNVNFAYNESKGALYHNGELGLIGLNKKKINKKVNGLIAYEIGYETELGEEEPDKLKIYLEIDEFNWIYFHFEEEIVYTFSTFYDAYNYPLQVEVDKRKKSEGPRFEMSSEDEVLDFKENFSASYEVKE